VIFPLPLPEAVTSSVWAATNFRVSVRLVVICTVHAWPLRLVQPVHVETDCPWMR
jgi:hypothetical protein